MTKANYQSSHLQVPAFKTTATQRGEGGHPRSVLLSNVNSFDDPRSER